MTLLVTVFAAIISTILWYQKENRKELRLGTLEFNVLGCFYYVVCRCYL